MNMSKLSNVVDVRSTDAGGLEILRDLEERKLSASPKNYEVWYHYKNDTNPALRAEIDTLKFNNTMMTDALFTELHGKYFSKEETNKTEVSSTMSELMSVIGSLASKNEDYNNQLAAQTDSLSDKMDNNDQLKDVLADIVDQLKDIHQNGSDFSEKLKASQNEIQDLRNNLEKANNEAREDVLTGINNRRAFDEHIEKMTEAAHENHSDLCLLMMDIDHFKQFNDTWGHQIGDEVLKVVAAAIRRTVRGKDIIARFGGEEFAVLLPETPTNGAHIVAENIRKLIANNRLKKKNSTESLGQITISIGVTRFKCGDKDETVEAFIKRADRALYSAKENGRNRVSIEL
jgi:diguanylate cyclase